MATPAKLLIIAGSDSGGGAGIQADLKTASALGVYGTTAITAITAQNTHGVRRVEILHPDLVAAQIGAVLDDIGADALKIGMLGSARVVHAVADALAHYPGPVVLDPVMVAKSGDPLLDDEAVLALRDRLLPRATLLTPNLPEAAKLLNDEIAKTDAARTAQGHALRELGAGAVLMKGGHATGAVCRDLLVSADGQRSFDVPRLATRNTHGTGCTMASAIAAGLATGRTLEDATAYAHHWLHGAIRAADALSVGGGNGPVHHFHEVWT